MQTQLKNIVSRQWSDSFYPSYIFWWSFVKYEGNGGFFFLMQGMKSEKEHILQLLCQHQKE